MCLSAVFRFPSHTKWDTSCDVVRSVQYLFCSFYWSHWFVWEGFQLKRRQVMFQHIVRKMSRPLVPSFHLSWAPHRMSSDRLYINLLHLLNLCISGDISVPIKEGLARNPATSYLGTFPRRRDVFGSCPVFRIQQNVVAAWHRPTARHLGWSA